jgi:hypothetical protein
MCVMKPTVIAPLLAPIASRKKIPPVAIAMLLCAVSVFAQQAKAPWTLTVDERIALRASPELARERVGSGKRLQTSSESAATPDVAVDAFDGQTHPELFLPHEVFEELMELAFLAPSPTGDVVRTGFLPLVKQHGLPPDFWQRLQAVSTVYLADNRAVRDLLDTDSPRLTTPARQRMEEALELKHADACRSRADALATARKEFGRERFDRFLYQVIAVNMFLAADRLADPEILRQAERGCR